MIRNSLFCLIIASLTVACSGGKTPSLQPVQVTITVASTSTQTTTREHLLAAGEMQLSGEPLAEVMQRDVTGYSRDHLPPDLYFDPKANGAQHLDVTGFSSAVESYEYSKQAMNTLAFESGAGTSLAHAPLIDAAGAGGAQADQLLVARVQQFATAGNALGRFVFAPGSYPVGNASGNTNPSGVGKPSDNPLGWPGIWPTNHVFASFDPSVDPTGGTVLGCAISSDDDPGASGALGCADYECDASSLHLLDHKGQNGQTISPGADGWSAWKYGLWVLNYLQTMHDSAENAVSTVAAADLPNVGTPGNSVAGANASGVATAPGTYLGSSDIEGFQAAMFIEEVDNRAEDWLRNLSTADGSTLGGFSSISEALAYDWSKPLRWFPSAIAVSETDDGSVFPKPTYALSSADSSLLDQLGIAIGFAEFYSLTDTSNRDVGGSQPAVAFFDGDPFPPDDQQADGEATLHDRALAVMRVALINCDRMHGDPASGLWVDDVKMAGTQPTRGTTLSMPTVAYTLLTLRTVRRSLSSQLELYSNNTPDTAISATPLDATPLQDPSDPTATFSQRLTTVLKNHAQLLIDHLTDATGRAWLGWDLAKQAPTDQDEHLDAYTAAIRGLFAAYLATGDVKFHDRALAVYQRMDTVFYDANARIYLENPQQPDSVEFTPLRFALLQSALRDLYELVAARPGGEALAAVLEARIGRLNKLVLNGWDDRNQDGLVDWPQECINVQNGLPRGGLQMAERTLTGEIGSLLDVLKPGETRTPTADREHDCVPEIDDAHLPAALADSIVLQLTGK